MNQIGKKIHQNCLALKTKALIHLIPLLLLSACAGDSSNIVYDTFRLGFTNPNTIIDEAPLNPNYRYLKVDANGQPALLVLGYIDQKKRGPQEVWYSSFKEVVEINGGRLANTEGLDFNWTQVQLNDAPSFSEVLSNTANTANATNSSSKRTPRYRYTRIRSVMPNYQVNIRETVIMQALNDIPSDAPKVFQDPKTNPDIRWMEETVLVPANNQNPSIKPLRAIYAINTKSNEVIFGKQYLTADFYVSWLSWPYPKSLSKQDSSSK